MKKTWNVILNCRKSYSNWMTNDNEDKMDYDLDNVIR